MFRSDDMQIPSRPRAVTQSMSQSPSGFLDLNAAWLSAVRWTVAMARRAFPAVILLVFLATAVAATIALRLAIWLPMYLH